MNKLRLILFLLLFSTFLPSLFPIYLRSQILFNEPYSEVNNLNYGFDKVLNTYIFRANGVYSHSNKYGSFNVRQNYVGTAITSISNDFRDDESFQFQYKYPVFESVNLAVRGNYLLNSDTRSSGVNRLERLNGSVGGEWNLFDLALFTFGYGADDHSQTGYRSSGNSAYLTGELSPYSIDGYMLNSRSSYDVLHLDNDRQNLDFFVNSQLIKEYGETDNLSLIVNYKKQSRDFIQPFSIVGMESLPIETRSENRFSSMLNLNFNLFDDFYSSIVFTFDDSKITRFFKNSIENNTYSFLKRDLAEQNIGFQAEGKYITNRLNQAIGISFQQRTETNFTTNKHDLNQLDYRRILNQDKQRDNLSLITRLHSQTLLNISDSDTIGANMMLSMNRYDTPSKENYDDRDEFSSVIGLFYGKYFSSIFKANFQLELIQTHLVFLKSQRSAMNSSR